MSKRQGNILGHGAFSIARGEFESKCICSLSIDFCQAVAVPLSEELFSGMYYIIPHWHCGMGDAVRGSTKMAAKTLSPHIPVSHGCSVL